jgi:hypothetical protein
LVAKERPLQKKLSRELFNFFVITILIKIFLKEHKNGVRLFKYHLGGEIHHDSRLLKNPPSDKCRQDCLPIQHIDQSLPAVQEVE